MVKKWLTVIQYLTAAEESRVGVQNHWNGVYLAGMKPSNRWCLSFLKVLFLLTLSTCMMMALSYL